MCSHDFCLVNEASLIEDWSREALVTEVDRLGNELARERARPGGMWDQFAYEQLAVENDRLREKLAAAETRLIIGVGGEFAEVRDAGGGVTYESTAERSALSDATLDAIRRRLEAMPPRGFQPAIAGQVVDLYRDLAMLLREVYRLRAEKAA